MDKPRQCGPEDPDGGEHSETVYPRENQRNMAITPTPSSNPARSNLLTVHAPVKSRSREQAQELASVLPSRLTDADVLLDCRGTAIATPSFTDEILKQILIERDAHSLEVTNAPNRFAELLLRAAARLGIDDRLRVDQEGAETDRLAPS